MRITGAILLVVTIIFGQAVSDPYRWLENASSPRTQAWIDAQNARADRAIDRYAGNERIASRIERLELTGEERYGAQLAGNTLLYMREIPPQPQPMLVAQPWPTGPARVAVDPEIFGSAVSIDYVWPSPSGKLVALATSSGGSEAATIRVVSLDGKRYSEALGPAGGGTTGPALVWDANERGFTYGRLPAGGSQFGMRLYHHVLGTPQSADTLALRAISPIAEYELIASSGAARAAALVQFGDGSPYRVYLHAARGWRPVVGPQAGIVSGAYIGSRLLVVATAGSPHGRIAAVGGDGTLRTIVAQAPDWADHDIAPVAGGFLVTQSWGTAWRVAHFDDSGRLVRAVPLPASGIGIDGIASSVSHASALIEYSGWTTPLRWVAYDARTGALRTLFAMKPASNDYAGVAVREIAATSRDGTRVPVTVLSLRGTHPSGRAPAILTGYGGFRISSQPYFIGPTLAWLRMGGVFAVANIRGGSEYGEGWHQAGMLENKQHVFDDFYASARALVQDGYTDPAHLGIVGGSNGGLLVGAALVQHPSEYAAVVGEAGIYRERRKAPAFRPGI